MPSIKAVGSHFSVSPTTYQIGKRVRVSAICDDGYVWDVNNPPYLELPIAGRFDFTVTSSNPNATKTEWVRSLTSNDTADDYSTMNVYGTPVEKVETTPITIDATGLVNCHYTITPSAPNTTDKVTVDIYPNTDYDLTVAPSIKEYPNAQITQSTTKHYAFLITSATETTLTLVGEAVKTSVAITINISDTNLKNCTATITPTAPVQGDEITITFKPNTGYYFTSDTTCKIDERGKIATVAGDGTSATLTFASDDTTALTSITPIATATEIPSSVPITINEVADNLENCTVTWTPSTPVQGDTITFTFTANDNYYFRSDDRPHCTEVQQNAMLDSTGRTATLTYDAETTANLDTLTPVANGVYRAVAITISGNDTNASVTYTPTSIVQGDEITFTFTANNGYEYTSAPYVEFTMTGGVAGVTKSATISDDKLTATLSLTHDDTYNIYTITWVNIATIRQDTPTTSYDFVNVYALTSQNMKDLAKVRFYTITNNETLALGVIDLAQYITSVKKFYIEVPVSVDSEIALATIGTGVTGKLVASDTAIINCGSVTIESTNKNNNDFDNTDLKLILPFIGMVDVGSELVGETVTLRYDVSMITGDCVAKLFVNGIVRYTFFGNVSVDIPYIINYADWNIQNTTKFNSGLLYGFTPELIVNYHENYNESKKVYTNDNKRVELNTISGYNAIDDIVINGVTIPDDEIDLIRDVLRNGVIF